MEQGQGDSIKQIKAEPSAEEFELETNRSTPTEDIGTTDNDNNIDETEIPVISVKPESETVTITPDGSGDNTAPSSSNPVHRMEDPFASLKNLPSTASPDEVIDLSKKVGSSPDDASKQTSAPNVPSGAKDATDEKGDPWPVLLTPAGPPAFPSSFPVFPGMPNPPAGYMVHPNNLPEMADYDAYLEEARKRSMKQALESNKSSPRRGRSLKNKLVVVTKKDARLNENKRSGRRKNATPKKKADEDTEEVKYVKKAQNYKCKNCSKSYRSSAELEKHEKSHTRHQCGDCDKAFGTKAALKQHVVIHEPDLTYECHYCNKIFIGRWRYDKHIQTHGDETPYKCVMCEDRFVDWRSLNTHEKTHDKPYKCIDCDKVFEELRALKKHSRTHTDPIPPTTNDPQIFKCSNGDCDMEFKKKNQLKRHERKVHPPEYLCKHCGKTLKDKSTFEKHEKRHMGEKHYICNYCGKMFVDQAGVTRHERVHTGEKPFKCKICEKGFASSSAVAVHLRIHTGETPFPCKFCGKKFSTQSSVYLHLRIHSDTRDFKCTNEGCGKAFRQKAALIMHERRHTGERPFKCQFCNKDFTENRSLIRHERLHTGEKPFVCKYCGKAVTDQSTLTRHEHSHSDVKRFKCQYCEKRFTWHQHQLIHELLHTGEKPHQCTYCDKRFVKKANLTEHERIHTGDKPYKCRHCDKAFNQRGACRTHEHTHMGTKPYKCEKCDKSFSWRHLLAKHEQSHFDVHAPLAALDMEEELDRPVKKPKTDQKRPEKIAKIPSAGANIENQNTAFEKAPHAPDKVDDSYQNNSAPLGNAPSFNAHCLSLANTVNALHKSIVTALNQDPSGMNVLDPNASTSNENVPQTISPNNREGLIEQTGHTHQISRADQSINATYHQSPQKSVIHPSHIPSYEEVMNLSQQKNLDLPVMPRVMCSPTQMQRQENQLPRPSFHHPEQNMTERTYVQSPHAQNTGSMHVSPSMYGQKAVDNMASPRLVHSNEMAHPSLSHQHEQHLAQQAYMQQHEMINDPRYEQVINNEVEVSDTSDSNVTLHQQISHIMTAFNQNIDTAARSIDDIHDNSKVIILSVPKP